jgi:hypothetical protein
MLDQALRLIDDIGLTTNAPAMATFEYWRNIRRLGRMQIVLADPARRSSIVHTIGAISRQ